MTVSALPPLISSDGHLEVRPERWTPRMPAALRALAPRTIKLPDGGDALLVEGNAPYPAPFLDLRAGAPTRRGSRSAPPSTTPPATGHRSSACASRRWTGYTRKSCSRTCRWDRGSGAR